MREQILAMILSRLCSREPPLNQGGRFAPSGREVKQAAMEALQAGGRAGGRAGRFAVRRVISDLDSCVVPLIEASLL